jgi:methylated-DNA-[protein]-cysteine S-methyltransferase
MYYDYLESPIGALLLAGNGDGLKHIEFPKKGRRAKPLSAWSRDPRPLRDVALQLKAYFAGKLTRFDLELSPEGTDFQRQVWKALRTIPYGKTISYKDLAVKIGNPKAVRAVGGANGRNPIPIVIPCHRVIGADGSLTGFGGGVDVKYALLSLEIGRDYNLRLDRRLQPKQRVMF